MGAMPTSGSTRAQCHLLILRRPQMPPAAILQQAAEADHLESDTYKRLNLALMWWGLGTATALWLAPQQPLRLSLG